MSLDLKIEIFGYYIFEDAFLEGCVVEIDTHFLQIYTEECFNYKSYMEACDDVFLDVYYIRDLFFSTLYMEEIDMNEIKSWRCLSDFFDHVTQICNRDDLFGHLNIFDKMFATCIYVLSLCIYIHADTIVDVLNYGYIAWAMYFDQFSEKFYKEGGWNELKKVSETYNSVYSFLTCFKIKDLRFLKEATVNYFRFKMDIISQEGTKHISKQWIKFHVRHFDEYAVIQTCYEDFADCNEIEFLLQDLKLICNSSLEFGADKDKTLRENLQRNFCFPDKSDSKINDMFEKLKTIDNEGKRNIERFETLFQDESLATSEEIVVSTFIDKVRKSKGAESDSLEQGIYENKSSKTLGTHSGFRLTDLKPENKCSVIETFSTLAEKTADLGFNDPYTSFDRENEKIKTNTKALKQQFDKLEASNFLSVQRSRNEDLEGLKRFYPDNLPNPIDLHSDYQVNENNNPKESLKSASGFTFSTKSVELCNKTNKLTDVLSTDPTIANLCRGNAVQKTPSSSKDSSMRIGITNENDGQINTTKELNKLRKEQKDPKMRRFLRMILVLGDIQGIQYVCGKFCNTDGDRHESHAKSNKGKKKTQKKSGK